MALNTIVKFYTLWSLRCLRCSKKCVLCLFQSKLIIIIYNLIRSFAFKYYFMDIYIYIYLYFYGCRCFKITFVCAFSYFVMFCYETSSLQQFKLSSDYWLTEASWETWKIVQIDFLISYGFLEEINIKSSFYALLLGIC